MGTVRTSVPLNRDQGLLQCHALQTGFDSLGGKLKLDAAGLSYFCERVKAWISPAGQRTRECDPVDFGAARECGYAALCLRDIAKCFHEQFSGHPSPAATGSDRRQKVATPLG